MASVVVADNIDLVVDNPPDTFCKSYEFSVILGIKMSNG